MPYFNIVAQTSENTVVTEFVPVVSRSDTYQSESGFNPFNLIRRFGLPPFCACCKNR